MLQLYTEISLVQQKSKLYEQCMFMFTLYVFLVFQSNVEDNDSVDVGNIITDLWPDLCLNG